MGIFIALFLVAVAVAFYFLWWRNRAPKFTGVVEQDYLNVAKGIVHPELEAACQSMLTTISERVTAYYKTPHIYKGTVLQFVQKIEIVDSLPNGANGDISRAGTSEPTTMQLLRRNLSSMITFQHELVHRVVWDDPELTAECAKYAGNGYHWPVLFDPFGSH